MYHDSSGNVYVGYAQQPQPEKERESESESED